MQATAPAPASPLQTRRIQSPNRLMLRRFAKEKTAVFGLAVIVFFALVAVFAPLLTPYDPLAQDIPNGLAPPSAEHWLGTDKLGRDIFSRMLYGARISLGAGLGVVLMAGLVGTSVGIVAGYVGGWLDEALMRITDIFFAFPSL
ncbi:MAG: D,D-dipeptide ABC transporter permease, partial [Caldilinea sp.]|nr:D,D-dipeptide ABC transporter permease [Caldilinea sp.]